MALLRFALAGAVVCGLYRFASRRARADRRSTGHAAFAEGETDDTNFAQVRDAGPAAMRSDPAVWDQTDQTSDESFPASDPPGTY